MRRCLCLLTFCLAACQVGTPGVVVPRPSGSVADVFADVDATAAASPVPSATPSPLPSPQQTGRAMDVAIAGPGGFALALTREPRDLTQVRLSRRGRFAWLRVADDDGHPWWRLVDDDGTPVLGYELASADPNPLPAPGHGRSFYSAFGLDGGFYRARVLEVDASANPLPDGIFDYRGLVRLSGGLPVDDQGRPRALFLAVARPDGDDWRVAIATDLRVGWLEGP